jgi:hypothetical protein
VETLLNDGACEHLFIVKTGAESLLLTPEPVAPEKFAKKGGVVAIKLTQEPLTLENVHNDLIFFELSNNVLQHCYTMFHDVFGPVI